MRTTVTLDRDVERMLRDVMHGTRRSFKETLNAALRAGLRGKPPTVARRTRFVVKAKSMASRPGIDPASFNHLADDLEVDVVAARLQRPKRA